MCTYGMTSGQNGSPIAARPAWTAGDPTARLDAMGQVVVSLGGFVQAGPKVINTQIRWRYAGDPLAAGSAPGDEWWVDDIQFSDVVVRFP